MWKQHWPCLNAWRCYCPKAPASTLTQRRLALGKRDRTPRYSTAWTPKRGIQRSTRASSSVSSPGKWPSGASTTGRSAIPLPTLPSRQLVITSSSWAAAVDTMVFLQSNKVPSFSRRSHWPRQRLSKLLYEPAFYYLGTNNTFTYAHLSSYCSMFGVTWLTVKF